MAAIPFTHIHSSSRFDRPIATLTDAVTYYHTIADLCTYTEMGDESRLAAFTDPGWSYYHDSGDRGGDECVIEWKESVFNLVGTPESVKITEKTWRRSAEYGGNIAAPVHVIRVTLEPVSDPGQKIAVMAAHMPLSNTALRRAVWIDCCAGWVSYVKNIRENNPGIKVLLAADWNRHNNEPAEHQLMQTHIAGPLNIRQAWDDHRPAVGGTHGARYGHSLIDGDMSDLIIRNAWLVKDDDSSDHRPYAVQYRVGQGSPVPSYEEAAQSQVNRFIEILTRPTRSEDDSLMKILSFNVRRDHSAAEVVEDVGKSIARCDASIVGLQEGWQYDDEIVTEFSDEWKIIHPTGADAGETERISAVTVMLKKDRFYVQSFRAFKGCNAAGSMPQRWSIEVVAEHIGSGQVFKYINTHMNAGVQPYGSNTGVAEVGAYRDHMNTILEVVENTDDEIPLFISADWNVSWPNPRKVEFWPMRALGRHGLVANWSYDRSNNPDTTFKGGASLFDQIYHRRMGKVRFKGDQRIKNDHSDHFGVSAAYALLHVKDATS